MTEQLLRTAYGLHRSGRFADAERLCAEVLKRDQRNLSALEMRGAALSQLGRHAEALAAYDRALTIRRTPQLQNNCANALLALGRIAEAVENYDVAIGLDPAHVDAWCNRGIALLQMTRTSEALESFRNAATRRPDHTVAWEGIAATLVQLERRAEAIAAYDRLIAIKGPTPELLYERGNTHAILKNYPAAIGDCEALLATAPDHPYALGVLAHAKMQICDWRGMTALEARIGAGLEAGRRVISPFNLKSLSDSPEQQLRCAELWTAYQCPQVAHLSDGTAYPHDRIKLAYVSADFGNSAVGNLIAPVLEAHNRNRFETIAVSFGSPDNSPTRRRLESAFERFVNFSRESDAQIAAWMRQAEIDIAVDLMGFTGHCRSAIFAHRTAPLQVNYLGFPGSLGATFYDYIIADPVTIPAGHERHYTERVARLPHCYLPADPARLNRGVATRQAAGLPASGIVFASFNNSYKISALIFASWMRILGAVDRSVLWLPEGNAAGRANLLREAATHGITPERIVFAQPIPAIEDHLARLSLADLFLDTYPYNSHSTSIDALSAGVPIMAFTGNSFASRVAASALTAAGLPELVGASLAEYEKLAVELALDPAALAGAKKKVAGIVPASPLFNVGRYTRDLESAFATMWRRSRAGSAPAGFAIAGT